MRTIVLDMTADRKVYPTIFGGYVGEHNATQLEVRLPQRLLSPDLNVYRFSFETSLGEVIFSLPCPLIGDTVSTKVWKQLTVGSTLKFNVCAFSVEDDTATVLEKTGAVTLKLSEDIHGQEVEPNIIQQYSESEFEKLLNDAVALAENAAKESVNNVNEGTVRNAGAVMGVYDGDEQSSLDKDEHGYITIPRGNGSSTYGSVRVDDRFDKTGLNLDNGALSIVPASDEDIDNRNISDTESDHRPIVSGMLDHAVKAAFCDGKAGDWTDAEKEAAQQRIGVYDPLNELKNTVAVLSGKTYYTEANDSNDLVKTVPANTQSVGIVNASQKHTIIVNQLCDLDNVEETGYLTRGDNRIFTLNGDIEETQEVVITPISDKTASLSDTPIKTLSEAKMSYKIASGYAGFDLDSNVRTTTDTLGDVLCCETWRSNDYSGITADFGTYTGLDAIRINFSICSALGKDKYAGTHKVVAKIGDISVEFERTELYNSFVMSIYHKDECIHIKPVYAPSTSNFDRATAHQEIIEASGATHGYSASWNYPNVKFDISVIVEQWTAQTIHVSVFTNSILIVNQAIDSATFGAAHVYINNLVKSGSGYVCGISGIQYKTCDPLIEAGHKVLVSIPYVYYYFDPLYYFDEPHVRSRWINPLYEGIRLKFYSRTGSTSYYLKPCTQCIIYPPTRVDKITLEIQSGSYKTNRIRPIVIDLTKAFGAGEEPNTPKQVYQYFGNKTYNAEYMAYSTGTPVDIEISKVTSKDSGGNVIEEISDDRLLGNTLISLSPNGTVSFTQAQGTKIPMKTVLAYQVKAVI